VNFLDADGLSGKGLAEIDFLASQTDAAATGDHDGFVVEGIVDVRQSGVGTRGGGGRPRPDIACPELRADARY
jgi:hypothetical protein